MIERWVAAGLRRLEPEAAHDAALRLVRLRPGRGPVARPRLTVDLAGMRLANPVGLAAGFDKNAVAVAGLARAGFGWLEVGAATPLPQPGNPRPRLFRLAQDGAVINRFGFNNDGVAAIAARLADRPRGVPVGLNLGANKDSADRAGDYAAVLRAAEGVDFATVNVSSPNTAGLRDLQGRDGLARTLEGVLTVREGLSPRPAVFVKIAPDLDDAGLAGVADVALSAGIDGIVATNTTLARGGLHGPHAAEAGGLSGAPLFDRSTRVLARLYRLTEGRVPLVGVGGIGSAADAYAKVRAGATAVQLYTALVYSGLGLVREIAHGLEAALARDGLARLADAVGRDADRWD